MCPSIQERITDERLQAARVVGLVTVPWTVFFSVGPVSSTIAEITGIPFLAGCLLVGYAYSGRKTSSWYAGYRMGFVASLGPILAGLYEAGPELWTGTPWWFRALAGVTMVAAVPFFGLVGALLAPLSEKVAETLGSYRSPGTDV